MKRTLTLFCLSIISIFVYSQPNKNPSIHETMLWIEEKLETNTYYANDIQIKRNVSFDILSKTLTIEESNYQVGNIEARYTISIPLDKLNPSSVLIDKGTEKWDVFHLVLKTNNGSKDIKFSMYYYYNKKLLTHNDSEVKIFVSKNALLDNLDSRLREAFLHAIKLLGGTSREVF